jgi:hypothetical protein
VEARPEGLVLAPRTRAGGAVILLGYDDEDARAEVVRYCETHPIRRVVVIASERFLPMWTLPVPHEVVAWSDVIRYVFFYRLLQEIDGDTLVVVYECLRTQDRHDLTYNCIRHYLHKTPHRLIVQRLPIIDDVSDVMTLVDFATDSRWKREQPRAEILRAVEWSVRDIAVSFDAVDVATTAKERDAYARQKRALIDGLGVGDPHTIPRNLLLLAGRAKARWVAASGDSSRRYLGRNARLGIETLDTYDEAVRERAPYTVLEFCHRFIDFSDVVTATGQATYQALVTDLKVDRWYFDRFVAWAGRVRDAYSAIRG